MSITSIFGPLNMNSVLFAYFTAPETPVYLPGAPMLLGALLAVVSAVLARRSLKRTSPYNRSSVRDAS